MADAVAPACSLEPATFSGTQDGGWVCTLHPDAGEASIVRVTHAKQGHRDIMEQATEKGKDRAAKVAAKRARSHVRRYTRSMRLKYLWTLTTAAEGDFQTIARQWELFYDRFRKWCPRLPFVAVFEPHKNRVRWHVHFATDRFIPIEDVQRLWGLGWVWVGDGKKLRGRVQTHKLSRYLSKYVTKTLDGAPGACDPTGRQSYQHRYRCARGYTPTKLRGYFTSPQEAYTFLHQHYGQHCAAFGFSVADTGDIDAWWFEYPDECLHPPPPWREPR